MNKKILFLLFLFTISLIPAETIPQEVINISQAMNLPEKTITGYGLTYDISKIDVEIKFKLKDSYLNLNGNLFENILSLNERDYKQFLRLNLKGELIQSLFIVDENGGKYIFENKSLDIPPESIVSFDKINGVQIELPKNVNFSKFPNLLNYLIGNTPTSIKGDNLLLPNGILLNGEVSINEEGFLLQNGEATYKKMLFSSTLDNEILIANENANLEGYAGNWIRQTSNLLEMQSANNSFINLEFLAGHDIMNTDDKDNMIINAEKGDGLKFEKRADEGLIPLLTHKSSANGKTIIYNDKLELDFNKDKLNIFPPKPLSDDDFEKNKFQSVAFELKSNANLKEKIRVNSYSQFVVLSDQDNELVSYNKYNLPVSAKIEDNKLQTIQQLREKYPEITFNTLTDTSGIVSQLNDSNLPPLMVGLTNSFLESHPEAKTMVNEFEYSEDDISRALNYKDFKKITLGRFSVDPYEIQSMGETFSQDQIMRTLTHEYEHVLDFNINDEEDYFLAQNPNEKEDSLFVKYNDLFNSARDKMDDSKRKIFNEFELEMTDNFKMTTEGLVKKHFSLDIPNFIDKLVSDDTLSQSEGETLKQNYLYNSEQVDMEIAEKLMQSSSYRSFLNREEYILLDNSLYTMETMLVEKREYDNYDLYSVDDFYEELLHRRINDDHILAFENIAKNYGGLPSLYPYQTIEELPTTYREESAEFRKSQVNSANPIIANMYKKLTQLEFDSGKMGTEEYTSIMGESFCKNSDCSDKICSEYKLLCCQNHPESINC